MFQFLAQWEGDDWMDATRFFFLVVLGSSRAGKTQWVKHLFGARRTLVIDCQNQAAPCMHGFRRRDVDLICLDEGSPILVDECKLFLQSSSEGCTLYQSRCNGYSKWYFLHAMPVVVSTNEWLDDRDHRPTSEWLRANSIVLEVGDEPMYY